VYLLVYCVSIKHYLKHGEEHTKFSLQSLTMNAQYSARTGRDYCCVGLKRTENEKETRTMWAHPEICDERNNGLFWAIFKDLSRDEARFNCFRMYVDS